MVAQTEIAARLILAPPAPLELSKRPPLTVLTL